MDLTNHKEVFEHANYLEGIYLPKLDAVVHKGDGALIHTALTMKANIMNSKILYQMYLEQGQESELLPMALAYRNSIYATELWLLEIAQNL